jgi:hypothetical protein
MGAAPTAVLPNACLDLPLCGTHSEVQHTGQTGWPAKPLCHGCRDPQSGQLRSSISFARMPLISKQNDSKFKRGSIVASGYRSAR